METIKELLEQFKYLANNPRKQLDKYLAAGKKAVGIFPYYAPEDCLSGRYRPVRRMGRAGAHRAGERILPDILLFAGIALFGNGVGRHPRRTFRIDADNLG